MRPIAVTGCGMATGVGLGAAPTCAAIRTGIDGFRELRFMIQGEWVRGAEVPLPRRPRGRDRWLELLAIAIEECLDLERPGESSTIPIVLCLPEGERPGRSPDLDATLLPEVRLRLALEPDPQANLHVVAGDRVGLADALALVHRMFAHGHPAVVIAGVDSFLSAGTLQHFHERGRLLAGEARDGFLPGEAAAAVVVRDGRQRHAGAHLQIVGMGLGREPAPVESGLPLRADGLSQAIKAALADAGATYETIDYRLTDLSGEQYGFREASLALSRTMRVRKAELDIWHPADAVGEVGAAVGPLLLGVAWTAARKGYAPGPGALVHLGNDDGRRAALVVH